MEFLKFLVNIGLIFTIVAALPVDDKSGNNRNGTINYRLPDNVVPVHYNIKLIPHIKEDNFTFDGESNINIEIRCATRNISLHVLHLKLDEAMTKLINSGGNVYTPTKHDYDNKTDILILNFNNELSPGFYTLNMKYVGQLYDTYRGFYRKSYTNKKGDTVWIFLTQFEYAFARRAFPCWDEPALKATFDISIKHHRNYTALSNMPVKEQLADNENDILWTHFNTTPVMSTYLVAFVLIDFAHVSNADKTINIWCRSELIPHVTFIQDIAEKSEQFLTQYTNSTRKVPKMDHVAMPGYNIFTAMENWGLILYRENYFVYDEESDTTIHKLMIARKIVHAIAHQWFGNLVSPSWWSDTWLKEGFASFMEIYVIDQIFKDWRYTDWFVVNIQQSAFHTELFNNATSVKSEINNPLKIPRLLSFSNYQKAPSIVRMLQHIMTEEVFRKGLVKYLHTHEFSSATSDDLWNALQAILDESEVPHDDYRLKEVMDTWINQKHYPMVSVTRNYDTGEMIITQQTFRFDTQSNNHRNASEEKWWIPLTFATKSNPNFSNTVPTHWLKPQDENITIQGIDPNDWVIVNIQQMGYYIVNYDIKNWEKIVDYLLSEEYTKIHVLNRAQIISDAFNLLVTRKLPHRIISGLMTYMLNETDYLVHQPIFNIYQILQNYFKIPEMDPFKEQLSLIWYHLNEILGSEEEPTDDDLTKITRYQMLRWKCTFELPFICKATALRKLVNHLADPATHKISPNLKEWTYCTGIMTANASIWNELWNIYVKDTTKKEFLNYLACSENPDILNHFLNISISNNSIIQENEYFKIYDIIINKHAENKVILDYILNNLKSNNISRGMDIKKTLTSLIDNVQDNIILAIIREFVKNNFNEEEILTFTDNRINQHLLPMRHQYQKYENAINWIVS